ncbi:MAG: hypothetical protein KAT46_05145, partial [Deltaproteobacteria bacterium]|nr:hypothetical protein [Deltaproteobacteria bacterium]
TFAIYDADAAGNTLWTETQVGIDVINGLFTVTLGETTPIDSAVISQANLWLGVTVGIEPEMTPRQELTSVAFALQAGVAVTAESIDWTGITSVPTDIADGDSDTVGALSCAADQVAKSDGAGTWSCADDIDTNSGGTVTSITAGTGLTGGAITLSGTVSVDVGTGANQIVQLDASAKLPAVDGSQLTNLPSSGGVPTGFMILGTSTTPPTGYTYTGDTMSIPISDGVWTVKADMTTARQRHGVAVVNNKIYVIGGDAGDGSTVYSANEEYDPATNSWTTKTSMPTPRLNLVVEAVNSKIYAIGGMDLLGTTYSVNEEYDPSLNTWTTKAAMPSTRLWFAGAMANNKIYVIGGYSGGSYITLNEEYDPAGNTWSTKSSMLTARDYLVAVTVDNKIYAIGGWDGSSGLSVNEEYDTVGNSWATKSSMPASRYSFAAAAAVGTNVYVMGGIGGTTKNEEYDTATDLWTTKASLSAQLGSSGIGVVDDKIYLIGGGWSGVTATTEEYDPNANNYYYFHSKD